MASLFAARFRVEQQHRHLRRRAQVLRPRASWILRRKAHRLWDSVPVVSEETNTESAPQERWTAVDRYITDLLVPEDPALDAAIAASAAAGLPPIAVTPNQGKLLGLLARVQGARTILELGTLGGYSTIWLAGRYPRAGASSRSRPTSARRGRPSEHRPRRAAQTVELHVGPALETLPSSLAEGRPIRPDLHRRRQAEQPGLLRVVAKALPTRHVDHRRQRRPRRRNPRPRRRRPPLGNRASAACDSLREGPAEQGVDATAIQTVGSKGYDGFALMIVGAQK